MTGNEAGFETTAYLPAPNPLGDWLIAFCSVFVALPFARWTERF